MTASTSTAKPPRLDDRGQNLAVRSLLNIFAIGVSILVARNQMSAEGWHGLWPEWVASAKAGDGRLTDELVQLWIRHIFAAELEEAPASATPSTPPCKRCNAHQLLLRSVESQLKHHRANSERYSEAVKTLESERAANAYLTGELERFSRASVPATRFTRYDMDQTGVEYADKNGDYLKAVDVLPVLARAEKVDDATIDDAASWRALLGSARIRSLGSAGIITPLPHNYAHMGLEIWSAFEASSGHDLAKECALGADWLKRYVRIAAAAQRAGAIPALTTDGAAS